MNTLITTPCAGTPRVRLSLSGGAAPIAVAVAMIAVALATAPRAGAQDQFPTSPPLPAPLEAPEFPPFQQARLSNGLQLVLVERHTQPVLSLSLTMLAGSAYDPAGKEGLASMVAGLLTKGAADRDAEQIAAVIEGVGGSLTAEADYVPDFLTVQANVLSPDAPLAFSLLSDVVRSATFPVKEVDLARTQKLSELQSELADPDFLAERFFMKNLYGRHPYARRATPRTVRGITRDDLMAYQKSRLRPGGALLVIAGDIKLDHAKELAEKAFSGWTGSAPTVAAFPAPPQRTSTEIVLVHRPGSVQSTIVVGNVALGPADPMRYATTVANQILGYGSDSRLSLTLREEKGWTYGVFSRVSRPLGPSAFHTIFWGRTAVTDSALTEILAQLRRLRSQPVTAAELESAKGALVGGFPLTIQTAQQIAEAVSEARLLGLGADYLDEYRNRLAAITVSEVGKAARAAIRPDSALIVVVGDGAELYDELSRIAPVKIVSADGKPLTQDDLVAKVGEHRARSAPPRGGL